MDYTFYCLQCGRMLTVKGWGTDRIWEFDTWEKECLVCKETFKVADLIKSRDQIKEQEQRKVAELTNSN